MTIFLNFSFAGGPRINDPEPWGKAFSFSVVGHAALILMLILFVHQQEIKPKTVLTEVNFVEGVSPFDEPVAPPVTQPQDHLSAKGNSLGSDSGKGLVASHPDLPNKSPISSEVGTPSGEVVTSKPMTGPIVALDDFGLVGKKKGALKAYAGQTRGASEPGPSFPVGLDKDDHGTQIVLAKQNLGEIRKAESSLGTPLFSEKVAASSMKGHLKELASASLGESKKANAEHLKANPLDKDKWGQKKGPFSLEGPLKYRKILKMDLPPYPRWAEEQAIEASVSFRLWVDPKGKVKDNMYLEKTSGYNELDYLAKEALLKFVFVPIPKDQSQEDEWGVATFRFELSK